MTGASVLLTEVECLLEGNHLRLRPRSRLSPELLGRLRVHKAELLAVLRVKEALANGRRLKAGALAKSTELPTKTLYRALGELFDWYELSTNYEGYYWLRDPAVN